MLGPHTKSAKLIGTNECFSRMLFKDLYPWLEVIAVEKKIRRGPCSEIELLRDSLAQKCQISAADYRAKVRHRTLLMITLLYQEGPESRSKPVIEMIHAGAGRNEAISNPFVYKQGIHAPFRSQRQRFVVETNSSMAFLGWDTPEKSNSSEILRGAVSSCITKSCVNFS
jgi:hypothetical protein